MQHSTQDLCAAVNGTLVAGEHTTFRGVSIDTRTIDVDNAFFCIRGPRFDGHKFAADAVQSHARVIVVDQETLSDDPYELKKLSASIVGVENTVEALGDFAAAVRRGHDIFVIGLTGSSGKTTTKEFIRAILECAGPTLATLGNLNNHLGVPLTLLRLDHSHRYAVIEMGMNAPGEIDVLARIAAPDVGVVTTVGRAHLEGVGSIEGVARAKGELLDAIPEDGVAIFPSNVVHKDTLTRGLSAPTFTVGLDATDTIRVIDIETTATGSRAVLEIDGQTHELSIRLTGRYNVMNALLALGVARTVGVDVSTALDALARVEPPAMRSEVKQTPNGNTVVLDCYNANPQSMAAAVSHFASWAPNGVVVLGDMLELGDTAQEAHLELGRALREWSKDLYLVAVGPLGRFIADGAIQAGLSASQITHVPDTERAIPAVRVHHDAGRTILLKASRGVRLERVWDALSTEGEA